MSNLFEHLNAEQQQAVQHSGGPALVLAGAGSGKTTVLTTRAAWLIKEQGVRPESLLIVTFTNKAAGEIKSRIESLTGNRLPFSGTFHSLCAKILRRDGNAIGLDPNFVIYDTDDQTALFKLLCKEHGIDTTRYSIASVRGAISQAKNELLYPTEYKKLVRGPFQEHVAKLYSLYQRALDAAQALDFDDLLLKALNLLKTAAAVRAKYQKQFEHVLVDEYQDTNKAQYELTKLLAAPQNNLFVVGDFSQSIYAWRGADYHNMLQLHTDFPDIAEYRLEQNYRSHQTILDAATQVISQNTSHPILALWTTRTDGELIGVYESFSAQTEATKVTGYLYDYQRTYPYEDMAILYRTNAQSRAFEEALMKAGIPYTLVGGTKFYERSEVKDVLSYLKYVVNPKDIVSYERIVGLGKRRFERFNTWLQKLEPTTPEERATMSPAPLLKGILDSSNYLEKYDAQTEENLNRIENVSELINVAAQFETVVQFLENVALVQDAYFSDVKNKEQNRGVNVMSLHSAKGLEFSVVCMVGMEEGLLPHSRSLLSPDELEEERRLCYVGITRAKHKLYMSYARTRYQYGVSSNAMRSRFLNDIAPELLKLESDGYQQNNRRPSAFGKHGQYNEDSFFINGRAQNQKVAKSPARRYVPLDDDMLDGVLQGEIDIDALIEK